MICEWHPYADEKDADAQADVYLCNECATQHNADANRWRDLMEAFPWDQEDEPISGGDVVEFVCQLREKAVRA